MAVEPQMQRRWDEQLAAYVAASFRVLSLGNVASQAIQLVSKLVTVAILFFGAKLVIEGNLTVGELVAFNMLASRVSVPVLRLAQIWQDFHQARLSIERLGDILNTRPEPTIGSGRAALPPIHGEVTFEHVDFRYEVLNDTVSLGNFPCRRKLERMALAVVEAERVNCIAFARRKSEQSCRVEAAAQ